MRNTIAHGRRTAARFVLAQSLATAVVALGFLIVGVREALAALVGGLAVAAGNAVFAWRMFAPGIASARRQAGALYAGEALKWLLLGTVFYLAFARFGMPPLPLLAGVLAALFTFWVALLFVR